MEQSIADIAAELLQLRRAIAGGLTLICGMAAANAAAIALSTWIIIKERKK